jgi:hypothetical protein
MKSKMIKLLLIFLLTIPIIGLCHIPVNYSIIIKKKETADKHIAKRVAEYQNGELSVKKNKKIQ